MRTTTEILTGVFYYVPQKTCFKSEDSLIGTMAELAKEYAFTSEGFNVAATKESWKLFLKEMKKFITVKKEKSGFTVTKNDNFKPAAEALSNSWNSKYRNLLTKMAKSVTVSSVSFSDVVSNRTADVKEQILKKAKDYKDVDPQVSDWLIELAGLKGKS